MDVNDYRNKVKLRWYDIYQSDLYDIILNDLTQNIYKIIDSNANYRENTRWELTTDYIVKALKHCNVKNIGVKFSGNKGFHIGVPWESFPKSITFSSPYQVIIINGM